ncbi:Glu-tRNA(Gln) amidotransferase subunit GatD [Candidatus Woesearchaeota archaeon]|nr:Glu-tRNA(Gln) amidotransferase subunit GatD [Candidatus Woesearchaeota archaeon]
MAVKYQIGEDVEIITSESNYIGAVMPSTTKETLFLRLSSGYQVGINTKQIKNAKIISDGVSGCKKENKQNLEKNKNESKHEVAFNSKLPIISILHTGGTIASKVDYKTGAVIARFSPEELVGMFPELGQIANIKSRLVRNMWSQDMRFAHYNILAKEIKKEIDAGVDGIIITHGTDTLHYSAAALSFALRNLPIPVLLVGSQRSSDRGSSDASLNLINAAYFAATTDFGGIAICMHHSSSDDYAAILPATKTRKMHTSRRDAFKAINAAPYSLVDYHKKEINFLTKNYPKKDKTRKIELQMFNDKLKVGMLYQHTNMYAEQYKFYEKYDGVVIIATGLGNLPTSEIDEFTKEHTKILKAIEALVKKNVVVAVAPETINGRIMLTVYENQRALLDLGVLGNESDMTPETSFIKLAWLLSNYKKEDVCKLYGQNLRGEISERISMEMYEE